MKVITNSLGNLLLLSCGAENSSLKNYSFPVKKEISTDSMKFAYCQGSRSAREIAENDCWTINEISIRTDKLIQFMYNHWFATLEINRQEWDKCVSILRNNLPASLDDQDYNNLKDKLLKIDTSDERRKAIDAVKTRKPDYLQQQFLGYIDQDLTPTKYNAKKISYKDIFTFKIVSNEETPIKLDCGVNDFEKSYLIRYYYKENEIIIKETNKEVFLMSLEEVPDKLKPFILSLFRYLRKEFKKTNPIWINHD